MRRRIGYRNSKRMELFLLASMLDTVLRSRGNVVDEPPARCNDEAHKDIMDKIVVLKQVNDVHTPVLNQMMAAEYLTKHSIDDHIKKVCDLYGRKCKKMLDAMDKYFPAHCTYTRPEGGLFLWCTLPEHIDVAAFVKKALEKKVAVVPGTAFSPEESEISHSFRITYSTPSREQIVRGVKILADIIKEMM